MRTEINYCRDHPNECTHKNLVPVQQEEPVQLAKVIEMRTSFYQVETLKGPGAA